MIRPRLRNALLCALAAMVLSLLAQDAWAGQAGNAEEVRRGFKHSQHLLIDGAVHSDPLFLSSPKIKEVMLEFMRGQALSTTRIALAPLKFTQVKSAAN